MKKILLTAFAAFAVMAMVSCNNNKTSEAVEENTCEATEQCEKQCCKESDTTKCCKAECAAQEGKCPKAEGEKCCKAEGEKCTKDASK